MKKLENRIPPPFVTLLVAAAMSGVAAFSPTLEIHNSVRYSLVAVFFFLGALFGAPAIRAFVRAKTTIDPVHVDRASSVVTSGIYSYTRNPMYVAMTCLLLSWAAYLNASWSFLGPLLFIAFITRFQILPEERAMGAKFGGAYLDYKRRVRRWV